MTDVMREVSQTQTFACHRWKAKGVTEGLFFNGVGPCSLGWHCIRTTLLATRLGGWKGAEQAPAVLGRFVPVRQELTVTLFLSEPHHLALSFHNASFVIPKTTLFSSRRLPLVVVIAFVIASITVVNASITVSIVLLLAVVAIVVLAVMLRLLWRLLITILFVLRLFAVTQRIVITI